MSVGREVRAYTVSAMGADYHRQAGYHWIDDHVATPMARYPGFADSRRSFGLDVLGSLVIEVEADDGTVGFAVTTAGMPGAWIVEHHLARFVEGAPVTDLERIWDQMYLSTLLYGRKGLVLNVISGIDLALYDLLGKLRQEPVYQLLGGPVRDELVFYATGARPDLGPYGDAINKELMSKIDESFRTIGRRWGRAVEGGSTGGWIAAASLVFYPEVFAGAWAGYPDPLDFRAHQVINIYSDPNAYVNENPWEQIPRPAARRKSGDTQWTNGQENHYERAVASRGRSQGQWDIWQAVFGPQGKDGYPAPIWDKNTGKIDHTVAAYWHQHMELSTVVATGWKTLGPKIAGRMHIFVGTEDTFFLNDGVEYFEQKMNALTSPDPGFQYMSSPEFR